MLGIPSKSHENFLSWLFTFDVSQLASVPSWFFQELDHADSAEVGGSLRGWARLAVDFHAFSLPG